jgi:hypothetical protein
MATKATSVKNRRREQVAQDVLEGVPRVQLEDGREVVSLEITAKKKGGTELRMGSGGKRLADELGFCPSAALSVLGQYCSGRRFIEGKTFGYIFLNPDTFDPVELYLRSWGEAVANIPDSKFETVEQEVLSSLTQTQSSQND